MWQTIEGVGIGNRIYCTLTDQWLWVIIAALVIHKFTLHLSTHLSLLSLLCRHHSSGNDLQRPHSPSSRFPNHPLYQLSGSHSGSPLSNPLTHQLTLSWTLNFSCLKHLSTDGTEKPFLHCCSILLSDGMTYSILVWANNGTDRAGNVITMLFTEPLLATDVVYLFVSRSLPSNGTICHNIIQYTQIYFNELIASLAELPIERRLRRYWPHDLLVRS
jgi:hypothetical protein